MDPERSSWPPTALRNLTNNDFINEVNRLFDVAIPKCKLNPDLEAEFTESFDSYVDTLHKLRRDRNRILHSAYIELKACGETQEILRSNPKLMIDDESGDYLFDQELLGPDSLDEEMRKMAEITLFLNRAYMHLIHRFPNGGAQPTISCGPFQFLSGHLILLAGRRNGRPLCPHKTILLHGYR